MNASAKACLASGVECLQNQNLTGNIFPNWVLVPIAFALNVSHLSAAKAVEMPMTGSAVQTKTTAIIRTNRERLCIDIACL
jgi:hypothetical protein